MCHDYAYISFGPRSLFFKNLLRYNEKITIRQVRKGCSNPYIMTRILEKMSLQAILALDFGLFDFSATTYVGLLWLAALLPHKWAWHLALHFRSSDALA